MSSKILGTVALLTLAMGIGVAVGLGVDWRARDQAFASAFDRLRLFHNLRRAALEDYLKSIASDVRAASENPRVVDAIEKLTFAWSTFGPEAREVLPRLYIAENSAPPGEKDSLDDAGDGSYYSTYHRDFHAWAKRFRKHFGYYDVFLISPRGDVLYTVAKEIDFATNLRTGPYRSTPLADVFRRAMGQTSETVDFSDFARYPPSNDEPAAFAARAVRKAGQVIGVFAVQVPAEPLNELMHFTAGMGKTGETYLVGLDGLMRSQSRFLDTPTLLVTKVDNTSVHNGSQGQSGAHMVRDYRGIPVLSVYAPVDFGGQPWILVAEVDRAEVLENRNAWISILAGVIAGLAMMGLALFAWQLLLRRSASQTSR